MTAPEDTTFAVPRFLALTNLSYLMEAVSAADEHLSSRLIDKDPKTDTHSFIGNLNAARQNLLRAAFIASYAIVEQNLDEILLLTKEKKNLKVAPSDLKDRGISRSIKYAQLVLDSPISTEVGDWKDLAFLQDLRNHLVHYGEGFGSSREHEHRFKRYSVSRYVTLRPEICFTINQLQEIFELYVRCVDDFLDHLK